MKRTVLEKVCIVLRTKRTVPEDVLRTKRTVPEDVLRTKRTVPKNVKNQNCVTFCLFMNNMK